MFAQSIRLARPLAVAAGVSLYALSAQATVIVTGNVFPNLATNPTGNGQISVGVGTGSGAVEVNGSAAGNGFTEIGGTGLLVGNNQTGSVSIIGDGISGSAKAVINSGIGARIGFGGDGTLELRQGGILESNENIHLGEESLSGNPATATVTVDGAGSVLRSEAKAAGFGGGRIYVPFGRADSDLTVSDGGRVETIGGSVAEFKDGSVYIGSFDGNAPINVNVNVTGEGSTIEAQDGIYIINAFGEANVNVTDGGALVVQEDRFGFDTMGIGSFDANGAQLNISGQSVGGVASSLSSVGDFAIGTERSVTGFTAGGEPRFGYDVDTIAAGVQVTDEFGTAIFDRDGNPVVGVAVDFGGSEIILPSTYSQTGGDPIALKMTGHVLAENGATATIAGDVNISTNNADPLVTPVNGQNSSLTVRDGATFTADNIYVNADGLLTGGDGLIVADVHLNGGVIAPGNSPGNMTIDGDLYLNSGLLEIEVTQAMQDVLSATGSIFLGEELMIALIFDFDPLGEVIDIASFFNATSLDSEFNFDNLSFSGLSNNAFFSLLTFDGQEIQFDGSSVPVPAPISLILFGMGLIGLGWMRRRSARA